MSAETAIAAPAPEIPAVVEPVWEPRGRDWVYLEVVERFLAERRSLTDQAIATEMKVTRQAVRKMRLRPGFQTWVDGHVQRVFDSCKPRVLAVAVSAAMRGSIDHMNFCAKVGGWFPADAPAGPAGPFAGAQIQNFQLVMGVPATPAPDPEFPGGLPKVVTPAAPSPMVAPA